MILTGSEIIKEVRAGRIACDPFVEANVGPNSLDVTLSPEIRTYTDGVLDARRDNPTRECLIPEQGVTLYPGTLYLASTAERVGSDHYVTYLDGRSSTGRLGIQIHMTAGRGDLGFSGRWCLEIVVAQPVRVYAGMRIGQATFHAVQGEIETLYRGKYRGGLESSQMWRDFAKE